MSPYFIFFLSLHFSLLFFHGGATGVDLIKETCKKSALKDPNLSYDFCVTSLQADPKSHNANLKELGHISMKLMKSNATHTKLFIKKLLKQKKLNPYDKICLMDCFDLYSDGIATLKDAVKDFKSKRYVDANIKVSAVMDSSSTCEDGFKEKKGGKSPLTKKNNDMFQLTALAMSIINMLR